MQVVFTKEEKALFEKVTSDIRLKKRELKALQKEHWLMLLAHLGVNIETSSSE